MIKRTLLKGLTIGAILLAMIISIATIKGNLGIAQVKAACDDNSRENGYSYYCESITYNNAKVIIDMQGYKIGDKVLYIKLDSNNINTNKDFNLH